MFVCVIVTQYKLRHLVGFCKYMIHNISIQFSIISCYLYVSFASSCLLLFTFQKINQSAHPCYVRTKATAVLSSELPAPAPLCCSIKSVCQTARTGNVSKRLRSTSNENKMFYSKRLATNGFETRILWILIIWRITRSCQRAVISFKLIVFP